ncbi:hypothetical protein GCM10011504_53930 [Siccirubricoccus deserti]|nr:hypothetical protein GCM10011504_53930 [Siccirubricoccus deserti]
MSAYWMTFKPLGPGAPKGWLIERLQDLVERFDADSSGATEWWRIASHASARVDNRIYLFKQGFDPRGIFGVGTIVQGPEYRDNSSDHEGMQHRALIRFTALVDPTKGFLLAVPEIADIVPPSVINAQASGNKVADDVAEQLDRRLAAWIAEASPPLGVDQADDEAFDPDSIEEVRRRALRAIRVRRGQPAFRAALLQTYAGRCAITGCAVPDVLEAAHIVPYQGLLTNHVTNGLLLRADLHTLFDCGLIAVRLDTRRVVTSPSLEGSSLCEAGWQGAAPSE